MKTKTLLHAGYYVLNKLTIYYDSIRKLKGENVLFYFCISALYFPPRDFLLYATFFPLCMRVV